MYILNLLADTHTYIDAQISLLNSVILPQHMYIQSIYSQVCRNPCEDTAYADGVLMECR